MIPLGSPLPPLTQGQISVDGSGAGVILNGSQVERQASGGPVGISITSDGNAVRGLQIVGFAGSAISIAPGSDNRIVANVLSGNTTAVSINDPRSSGNVISGNLIGVGPDGSSDRGNQLGIMLTNGVPS